MNYQKFLAQYIKVPGIKTIDWLNAKANIYRKYNWDIQANDVELENFYNQCLKDFKNKITDDGIFHYRYHPDKLPDLIPDTGDMALHQGLALATACILNDKELAEKLFAGSIKFIEKGYLIRGINEKGEPNLILPSLDQLMGLIFGWTFYYQSFGRSNVNIKFDTIIYDFLWEVIDDEFKLRDHQGNFAKGMKSCFSLFLIDGDATVMLAISSFMEKYFYRHSHRLLSEEYGLSKLARYGHIHFLWWIRWFSFNINMLALATIHLCRQELYAYWGMKRLIQITNGWNMPFFRLLFWFCNNVQHPQGDLKIIKNGLYGYFISIPPIKSDKWYRKYPRSPKYMFNADWFPQRGNFDKQNNNNPDLWNETYKVCYARHDFIFQYLLFKKNKGEVK